MFYRTGGFVRSGNPLDARAHKACSIAHAERVSPRQWVCPFCKNRGRGRSCTPFRGFSFLIFRSERVLRSEHPLDARARKACFVASEVFIHSVARWTREVAPAVPQLVHSAPTFTKSKSVFLSHSVSLTAHTQCVPSRRSLFPFWKRAGRGRSCLPFYQLFSANRQASQKKHIKSFLHPQHA